MNFLFACLSIIVALHSILVDEVVAVVNQRVITRSEVMEEAYLILVERRGEEGLKYVLTPQFLTRVLDMLINQRVLLKEARRIGMPPVTEQERKLLLAEFQKHFSSQDQYLHFLAIHGLSEDSVSNVLVRHLRVARLKKDKLNAYPKVSDDAVREYYEKNQVHFGGAEFASVAHAIQYRLSEDLCLDELSQWVWELRRRSEVRVLVDLAKTSE